MAPGCEHDAAHNLRTQLGEGIRIGGIVGRELRNVERIAGGTADDTKCVCAGDMYSRAEVSRFVVVPVDGDSCDDDVASQEIPEVWQPGSRAETGETDGVCAIPQDGTDVVGVYVVREDVMKRAAKGHNSTDGVARGKEVSQIHQRRLRQGAGRDVLKRVAICGCDVLGWIRFSPPTDNHPVAK